MPSHVPVNTGLIEELIKAENRIREHPYMVIVPTRERDAVLDASRDQITEAVRTLVETARRNARDSRLVNPLRPFAEGETLIALRGVDKMEQLVAADRCEAERSEILPFLYQGMLASGNLKAGSWDPRGVRDLAEEAAWSLNMWRSYVVESYAETLAEITRRPLNARQSEAWAAFVVELERDRYGREQPQPDISFDGYSNETKACLDDFLKAVSVDRAAFETEFGSGVGRAFPNSLEATEFGFDQSF